VPTRLRSVATFSDPRVQPDADPQKNPTQAVAHWLLRDIVRGVFEPHERLKVELLTQFYRIGHSPVREAILLLSGTGLVVHEHQKGYRVAPVSLDDYCDVLEIYKRLYQLALSMAVERGGEHWEEQVVVALHRSLKVNKVVSDDDPEARELWQRTYKNLHREIVAGCRSPLLIKTFKELGDRLERYLNLFSDRSTDQHRDTHAEHRVIVDAVVARDEGRLHAVLDKFFEFGEPLRATIIEALRRQAPQRGRRAPSEAPEAQPLPVPTKVPQRTKAKRKTAARAG
jgi:GntR family transcriptional regulator, carbon starvation induced regulator